MNEQEPITKTEELDDEWVKIKGVRVHHKSSTHVDLIETALWPPSPHGGF